MNKANRKPRTRAKPAASVAPFLHKIYEILENPVHNDLISWNDEGTAFLIKNVTEFTDQVLPKYFKHNNFASFVRQLNLYDFHKSRYENNGSEFIHKLFRRNERHLLSEIKRKMPNEGGAESPPQYSTGMQEETGMENMVTMNGHGDASLQNLINRQDQMESALKMVFTENKRLSKENKMLWTEVSSLKTKQTNTDKVTKAINTQNNQLLKENRCLWSEMIMNKEKFERQLEKLLMLLFSLAQHSGKNPANIFKKKNLSSTRGAEEDDGAWATKPDNKNQYSVMPAKNYNNKKGLSGLEKIFEHFEEEGLGNLFGNKPFAVEEKDWIKLSSFLDVETGGNNNRPSLEFFNEKRPPQLDTSFDKEDPREAFSKMCKIEYDARDSAVATIVEEKNLLEVPTSPGLERLLKPEKLFDITNSPVPLEKAMNELELSPVAAKGRPGLFEYDVVHGQDTCFLQLQKNPSFFPNSFLEEEFENENENQQEEKRDISYFMNKSFNRSKGSSQIDISGKGDAKFDEVFQFFNTHQMLNNSNNGDNNDSFHGSFFNLTGMNAMSNDPNT